MNKPVDQKQANSSENISATPSMTAKKQNSQDGASGNEAAGQDNRTSNPSSSYPDLDSFIKAMAKRYALNKEKKDRIQKHFEALREAHGVLDFQLYKIGDFNKSNIRPHGLNECDIFFTSVANLEVHTSEARGAEFSSTRDGTGIYVIPGRIEFAFYDPKSTFTMQDAYNMVTLSLCNPTFGSKHNPITIEGTPSQRKLLEQAIIDINSLLPEDQKRHIANPTITAPKPNEENISKYFHRLKEAERRINTLFSEAYEVLKKVENEVPGFIKDSEEDVIRAMLQAEFPDRIFDSEMVEKLKDTLKTSSAPENTKATPQPSDQANSFSKAAKPEEEDVSVDNDEHSLDIPPIPETAKYRPS